MQADNTAHLRDAAQRRHEQARSRTLQALDSLREENADVTVSASLVPPQPVTELLLPSPV